jgi:tetratricopeptide (TPR) repeat protein
MRAVLLIVALVAVPLAARAEDRVAARAAYAEGARHYDLNEFAEALAAFRKAYWSYEEPTFLFNIAQCQRQLGNDTEALKFYRSYLRKSPNAPNRVEVDRIIAALESSTARKRAAAPLGPAPASASAATRPPTEPAAAVKPAHATEAPRPATTATTAKLATTAKPATTAEPATSPRSQTLTTSAVTATRPQKTPIYKKWWLWTAAGGAVAVGLGVGLGLGLAKKTTYPSAMTPDGTFQF